MIRKAGKSGKQPAVRRAGAYASAAMLLMSSAFITAVEAAEVENAEKAMQEENSDIRMDSLLSPLINEAVALKQQKKYEEAVQKCNDAQNILRNELYENTPLVKGLRSSIFSLKKDINEEWDSSVMDPLRARFDEVQKNAKTDPETRDALKELIFDLEQASNAHPRIRGEASLLIKAVQQTLLSFEAGGYDAAMDLVLKNYADEIATKVDPLIKEAEKLLQEKKFKQAMDRVNKAGENLSNLNTAASAGGFAANANGTLSGQTSMKSSDVPAVLVKRSELIRLRSDISSQWEAAAIISARQDYLKAVELASKEPKEALTLANSALNTARQGQLEIPMGSSELKSIEQACQDLIDTETFRQATSLAEVDSELADRRERIVQLMSEGNAFYSKNMFEKARDSYEQVLVLDPFNEKASSSLRKLYRKIYNTAEMRRENEALERINEVEWKWNPAILPSSEQIADDRAPEESTVTEKLQIYDKLRDIIIPKAEFVDMPVSEALDYLQKRSKEVDKELRGVTIIFSGSPEDDKEITMALNNVPLGEIIRYVCLYTGLKFRVDENCVTIGSVTNVDAMESRSFRMSMPLYNTICGVSTDVEYASDLMSTDDEMENPFEDMIDGNGGGGTGGGEGGGSKKGGSSKDMPMSSMGDMSGATGGAVNGVDPQLKNFFVSCGIPFSSKTKISYDKRSCKLFVTNTPDNLKLLEKMLRQIDVMTPLILIEAKIIEINVVDLEELGFNWTLTHNNTSPSFMTGDAESITSDFGSADTYKLGNYAVNQTVVRHLGGTSSDKFSVSDASEAMNIISDMNIMPNFGPQGAYNVFLSVTAVDQSQRGEILSAPKVIAYSGTPATVEMVQEMYFPDSWNDPEVNSNNNTYEYTPPYPEFGDAEKIGVTFTVEPTVSPNNKTITMKLNPTVRSLAGWTEYDYEIKIGSVTSLDETDVEYAPKMKMPNIATRQIETQVKAYDGETIVLGGVLKDVSQKRDDKYPFLGEVPLVGRLFASKGERSEKNNMLVFVTPRMMKLDGVPIKQNMDNGLFEFNR